MKELIGKIANALVIVTDYGGVLENAFKHTTVAPISMLPYPKETIKSAVKLWCSLLRNNDLRRTVRKIFPDQADQLLTEDYLKSLEGGYMCLSRFQPDEDALLCFEYEKPIREHTAIITNEEFVNTISGIKDRMEEYQNIQARVTEEMQELLDELSEIDRLKTENEIVSKK